MWFVLLFALTAVDAHSCCSTCACQQRCERPIVNAQVNMHGLDITCHDSECACVVDELDTCTSGPTWTGHTHIAWNDTRWHECIRVTKQSPLHATAILRWWHVKCMGHVHVNIDVDTAPVHRDLYVDFNILEFYEHTSIYNVLKIRTLTGSNDKRPMAGSSIMFFEAVQPVPLQGTHVEIDGCTVQMTAGKSPNAPILNEVDVFDVNRISSVPGGQRFEYDAFWDGGDGCTDCSNSPFQRLVCSYAIYNGTDSSTIIHNTVNRTYRMANPDETGILVNDVDDIIV